MCIHLGCVNRLEMALVPQIKKNHYLSNNLERKCDMVVLNASLKSICKEKHRFCLDNLKKQWFFSICGTKAISNFLTHIIYWWDMSYLNVHWDKKALC